MLMRVFLLIYAESDRDRGTGRLLASRASEQLNTSLPDESNEEPAAASRFVHAPAAAAAASAAAVTPPDTGLVLRPGERGTRRAGHVQPDACPALLGRWVHALRRRLLAVPVHEQRPLVSQGPRPKQQPRLGEERLIIPQRVFVLDDEEVVVGH